MSTRSAKATCIGLKHVAITAMIAACLISQLLPSSADSPGGQWRQKSQLIWDEPTRQLVRKTIRVWDSEPQQDREFYWEPERDQFLLAGEAIEGRGTLTWRQRGTPSYDRNSIRSTYHGEMKDGRPHGNGRLALHTGSSYEGTWVAGLMDGRGSLQLESGDAYVGEFRHGQFHGQGRYEAANGEVYEGAFANGERDGPGLMILPNGERRSGLWVRGHKVGEQGRVHTVQAARDGLEGVTISVTTDARKNMQTKSVGGPLMLTYAHQIQAGEVSILPDDKRFMSAWKQGGQMYNLDEEFVSPDYSQTDLFQSPVFARVSISSAANQNLLVNSLRLEVTESQQDLQPFLGVRGSLPDYLRFSSDPSGYDPAIAFINTGWGALVSARVSISFAAQGAASTSQLFELPIGGFDQLKKLSVERELQALDVDIAQLKS